MKQKVKLDTNSLKQLLLYLKPYRGTLILVTLCIVLSVVASTTSAMFLQTLIDNYIVPLIGIENPIYKNLINALIVIGIIYLLGTISTWIYNRQMVTIAQKTLKNIRDDMFSKMQNFSISYFDTNTNGDIMSLYTNDIDTLRQMISQAIPQLISSIFSIIAIFFCMIYISVWLTIVVCITLFFILKIIKMVSKKSNIYFMEQQTTLADLDSYIEEMINGQKVIKIFCREDKAKENFQKYNQVWEKNSSKANGYGNSMTPIVNVLGYIQYIVIAILGAYISIKGITNIGLFGTNAMTLGMIASFLTLSRNFINPISQISNQFNSITIMENIRYGNPSATDEECISAAKLVNADNFIRMLPQGYNTILKGDNSTLSHGQLQLISIARTAVANPPVMILDEATSSIDTRTEVLVQDGMNKLMKGRTVFIIAHRLSTIQNADTIIVLDHGKIIERGSHEQLIEKKGTYYSLHTNAFELQ